MDPRQQAAMALGALLLLADLAVLLISGEFNVALGGAGVSIFGLAFTLPRDGRHNSNGSSSGSGGSSSGSSSGSSGGGEP